jgi:ribosomal protein L6P/L9E
MRLGFEIEGGKYIWIINQLNQKVILKPKKKSKIIFGWDKKIKVLKENKYLMKKESFQTFYKNLRRNIEGIKRKWALHFKLIGVQYTYYKSKEYLNLIIGYNYQIRMKRPLKEKFQLIHQKRNLTIKSHDWKKVLKLGYFLRKIQCLEPYKIKGLIYQHEGRETIKLKPGKRQK